MFDGFKVKDHCKGLAARTTKRSFIAVAIASQSHSIIEGIASTNQAIQYTCPDIRPKFLFCTLTRVKLTA
jgi:hypothetical protein